MKLTKFLSCFGHKDPTPYLTPLEVGTHIFCEDRKFNIDEIRSYHGVEYEYDCLPGCCTSVAW